MSDPRSLAVLLDALSAAYGCTREEAEEAEKYARNFAAVRELLKWTAAETEIDEDTGYSLCPSCRARLWSDDGRLESHGRTCAIAAAWRALGDPRGQADIEFAHGEAIMWHLHLEDTLQGR